MSTAIAAVFTPGINEFFYLKDKLYAPQYARVFDVFDMHGRVLFKQGMQTYGPPQITLPLNPVHMDEIRQSFSKAYTPIKRTLGDLVAEEDWDDDEYGVLKRVIPIRSGALSDIFNEKKEFDAFNYLAITAYSTASPVPGSPDGVCLASASHPISLYNNSTTVSNVTSTPVALSHTVYYAAYAVMRSQKAPNNYSIIQGRPKKLLYNPTTRAVAIQLQRGDWERASGTQAFQGLMNAAKEDNLELIESPHYQKTLSTSAAGAYDGWALFGEGARLGFANRLAFRAKTDYDMNVQAYVFTATTRYDIGHEDYRNTYFCAN